MPFTSHYKSHCKTSPTVLVDTLVTRKIKRKSFILLILLISTLAQLSIADDREDELFGETEDFTIDLDADLDFDNQGFDNQGFDNQSFDNQDFDFENLNDNSGGKKNSLLESLSSSLEEQDDRLDIGGKLFFSTLLLSGNEADVGESNFNNNATVNIYFDAPLADDVRFFYQQKISHSIEGNDSLITLFLSQFSESSDIDQLWLKFSLKDQYYFTLGRQPTKLGSGLVWQPTDFLNADQFNPLDIFDQRLGVNLIKLQVPFSEVGINLYVIAQLNEVDVLDDIGALFRMEYLTRSGEYALTLNTQQKKASRFGFDFSKGIKILDFTLSAAFIHNDPTPFFEGDFSLEGNLIEEIQNAPGSIDRSDQWFRQVSSGFLYSRSVFETRSLLINGEVFYNQAGYENSDLLTYSIVNSLIPIANFQNNPQNDTENSAQNNTASNASFNPLYFSKYYAALGFTLMGLGADKDQTMTVLAINNLDDQTGVLQLLYNAQPFRDLSLSASMGWFYGGEGTFRPNIDFSNIIILEDLSVSPPRFSAEIQLAMVF